MGAEQINLPADKVTRSVEAMSAMNTNQPFCQQYNTLQPVQTN